VSRILGPDDTLALLRAAVRRSDFPLGQRVLLSGVVVEKFPDWPQLKEAMIFVDSGGPKFWVPAGALIPVDAEWTEAKPPVPPSTSLVNILETREMPDLHAHKRGALLTPSDNVVEWVRRDDVVDLLFRHGWR